MAPVISTQQLTRHFGALVAVDDLTMDIEEGEVFGFLGHNGAGKTTTVRLLNGVLFPTSGHVQILGKDPVVDGARIRAHTGVLTETPALDDRLTARATLRYFAQMFGVPRQRLARRVDDLLEQFGLADRADSKVGGFSKGMRQRLALARTIIHEPQIVFLDEPTSGLDPAAIRDVHNLIQGLRAARRTVFLATHNLNEAERLCDRVAVLSRGRVLALGTTRDLANQFIQGHRIVIEIDRAECERATQLLLRMPYVTQVEPANHGRNTQISPAGADHAEGSDPAKASGSAPVFLSVHGIAREYVPGLIQALSQERIGVYRVEPDEASLEDVYFALEHN